LIKLYNKSSFGRSLFTGTIPSSIALIKDLKTLYVLLILNTIKK